MQKTTVNLAMKHTKCSMGLTSNYNLQPRQIIDDGYKLEKNVLIYFHIFLSDVPLERLEQH